MKERFLTKEEIHEMFVRIAEGYGLDRNEFERMLKDPKELEEGRKILKRINLSDEIQKMRDEERSKYG